MRAQEEEERRERVQKRARELAKEKVIPLDLVRSAADEVPTEPGKKPGVVANGPRLLLAPTELLPVEENPGATSSTAHEGDPAWAVTHAHQGEPVGSCRVPCAVAEHPVGVAQNPSRETFVA